jgi:hypothetical protein
MVIIYRKYLKVTMDKQASACPGIIHAFASVPAGHGFRLDFIRIIIIRFITWVVIHENRRTEKNNFVQHSPKPMLFILQNGSSK